MELKFEMHLVKRTKTLHDEQKVNMHLQDGWFLLAAGFESDGVESEKCFIVGHLEEENETEDDFDRFQKELQGLRNE